MLRNMGWWSFVDWTENWDKGVPPGVENSHSAIITLQYAYTLQKIVTLLKANGFSEQTINYTNQEEVIRSAVFKSCFDHQKGLIAGYTRKENFLSTCQCPCCSYQHGFQEDAS